MNITDLMNGINDDFNLTHENVGEKVFSAPNLYSKYIRLYFKERIKLNKYYKDLAVEYKKLYHYYSQEYNFKLSNKEIEFHIAGTDEYADLKLKYNNQKAVVDLLDRTANKASFISNDIRNVQEYLKYVQGV